MTTASRPHFLRHFGRGPVTRQGLDLADMGTAFALDLAMDPPDYDLPALKLNSAGIAVGAPVAPWRLWLGRKLGA